MTAKIIRVDAAVARSVSIFDTVTSETFTMLVRNNDTMDTVKAKIHDMKTEWVVANMTLKSAGRILTDEKTVGSKNLIELVRACASPPPPADGELPTMDYLMSLTNAELKAMCVERGVAKLGRTKESMAARLLAEWFPASNSFIINIVHGNNTHQVSVTPGCTIRLDELEEVEEAPPEAAAAAVVTPTDLVFEILINPVTGTPFTLLVEGRDTINKVKGMILDKTGTPKSQQRLSYAGKELQKGMLADHAVGEGSELRLTQ